MGSFSKISLFYAKILSMNTLVLQLDSQTLARLKTQLSAQQIENANPYVDFAAKSDGVTVLVYTSQKVVFQGNGAQELAGRLGLAPQQEAQIVRQDLAIIGSDEVGNGSYFGGIAVVASFVTPDQHSFLKELGVDDSKQLTDAKIQHIAPLLEEKIAHKALLLSPQKYNQVVGKEKQHNAVSVKVALHNQAIFSLLKTGVKPDKIIVDAFTSPNNYQKYLKTEINRFANQLTLEEKAEGKYLAVAVSSIIARNLFLENLKELSQTVGLTLPSGAGSKSDQVASQILKTYGKIGLEKTAKLHFKNTDKAYQLLEK